jgi:hypothetical protein
VGSSAEPGIFTHGGLVAPSPMSLASDDDAGMMLRFAELGDTSSGPEGGFGSSFGAFTDETITAASASGALDATLLSAAQSQSGGGASTQNRRRARQRSLPAYNVRSRFRAPNPDREEPKEYRPQFSTERGNLDCSEVHFYIYSSTATDPGPSVSSNKIMYIHIYIHIYIYICTYI